MNFSFYFEKMMICYNCNCKNRYIGKLQKESIENSLRQVIHNRNILKIVYHL